MKPGSPSNRFYSVEVITFSDLLYPLLRVAILHQVLCSLLHQFPGLFCYYSVRKIFPHNLRNAAALGVLSLNKSMSIPITLARLSRKWFFHASKPSAVSSDRIFRQPDRNGLKAFILVISVLTKINVFLFILAPINVYLALTLCPIGAK